MKTIKTPQMVDNRNDEGKLMKVKGCKSIKSLIIISVLSWIILLTSCFPLFRHSDREGRRHHNERQEHHDEHHDDNNDRH